jgi:4-hydroxythreonine-4-phosphate dehydrogenase
MNRPAIAVTMGDPAGIGPEVCLKAIRDPRVLDACAPIVYGSAAVLEAAAEACGTALESRSSVVDCAGIDAGDVKPGRTSAACGRAAAACIRAAVKAALDGEVEAVVTAPISKEAFGLAGIPYPGHTEMLADLTGAWRYAMMLASDRIVVTLATIHMAYAHVPSALSTDGLLDAMELTVDALRRLGLAAPRLVVCGLNPHGGEGGMFGREEIDIIEPAVRAGRARGWNVVGPLPPDTAFVPERLKTADAHIAMYHDQGLIPFKMLAFGEGVNITLGLPIVRTSPDHGTAFDIAWQGKASAGSMVQAILWALRLAQAVQA